MFKTTLIPQIKPMIVNGKLIYHEQSKANAIIRLKHKVLHQFPQLKENKNWSYQMEYWLDSQKTIERIEEAKLKGKGVPLLLFIYDEDFEL